MPIIINGSPAETPRDPRVTVLDLVREHLTLPGTKKGCNQGACGACTVLVDGERVLSCLALAVQYEGRSITTVEGLSRDGASASPATGVYRPRRFSVRILHPGAALLGDRHA